MEMSAMPAGAEDLHGPIRDPHGSDHLNLIGDEALRLICSADPRTGAFRED